MYESHIKGTQPLLVIKYEVWKVLWRLFFPFFPVIVIGFMMGIKLITNNNFIGGLFFILIGLGALLIVAEMILVKEFQFEEDRIRKIWKIFGSKEIIYKNASLGIITGKGLFKRTSLFSFEEKHGRVVRSIVIDRHLISNSTEKEIFIILKKLFNKNGDETIQENSFLSLNS